MRWGRVSFRNKASQRYNAHQVIIFFFTLAIAGKTQNFRVKSPKKQRTVQKGRLD